MSKPKRKNLISGMEDPELGKVARLLVSRGGVSKRIGKALRDRECGECTLCCNIKNITLEELGEHSPQYEDCRHLCKSGGCGIHATRPKVCREYLCAWRAGYGPDEARPDRTGAIVDVDLVNEQLSSANIHFAGPFKAGPVSRLIGDMAKVLGLRHAGFMDRDTQTGDSYAIFGNPRAIGAALLIAARTGRAPWNGTKNEDEITAIVQEELEHHAGN